MDAIELVGLVRVNSQFIVKNIVSLSKENLNSLFLWIKSENNDNNNNVIIIIIIIIIGNNNSNREIFMTAN